MFKSVICLVLFFYSIINFAQNERNIWYFGQRAGLDFNSGSPVEITDNALTRNIFFGIVEGPDNLGVVNDEDGNLLFYTEGNRFYDKSHNLMPSSPTFVYSQIGSQLAVSRNPGNENQYYVFIQEQVGLRVDLKYFVVDMTLNNGFGDILTDTSGILIRNLTTQHLTTARHYNGRDIWVICISQNFFRSYLITENGIRLDNVTSQSILGLDDLNVAYNRGMMVSSPDSKKIAVCFPIASTIRIYDFDNLTGKLSFNDIEVTAEKLNLVPSSQANLSLATAEFTHDSKFVYFADSANGMHRINLENSTGISLDHEVIVDPNNGFPFNQLCRGPDRKIYSIQPNGPLIGAVNNPADVIGNVSFDNNSIILNNANNLIDFPSFLLPKLPLGISFENICLNEQTNFYVNPENEATNFLWNFDDNNSSSTDRNPSHTFSSPGIYNVSVQYNDILTGILVTENIQVEIYDSPIAHQPSDIYNCQEDRIINFTQTTDEVLINQASNVFNVTYFLTEEDMLTGTNKITEYNGNEGNHEIYVRIENRENPECFDSTSFLIYSEYFIQIENVMNVEICTGTPVELIGPDGFDSYLWSNGDTNKNTMANAEGTQYLRVFRDLGNYICELEIQYNIEPKDPLIIESISIDEFSGYNNSIRVNTNRTENITYYLGQYLQNDTGYFTDLETGEYELTIIDDCNNTYNQNVLIINYPRFFTPNQDGYNDEWTILNFEKINDLNIKIFDRYGKLLSVLNNSRKTWDGKYNGIELPSSDYWFQATRNNGSSFSGHFTLKR